LLSNATISSLYNQAELAHLTLQNFVENDLLSKDRTTIDFLDDDRPTVQADGFGLFSVEDYPLNDFAIFQLNNIKTLTANIGDYVRPLLSLEDVDVSSLVASLGNDLANLRSQLDVVTSQVQNLSSAPIDIGADEFVPGVVINQLQDRALATLAGADGVLTRDDIVLKPEISLQITTILDLFGGSGIEINADLVKDVVQAFFAQQVQADPSTSSLTNAIPFAQEDFNNLYSIYESRLKFPTDLNADGATTTADLLEFLIIFGDPNDPTPEGSADAVVNLVVQDILNLYNNA